MTPMARKPAGDPYRGEFFNCVELAEADFTGRDFGQFEAYASVFTRCNFSKIKAVGGNFGSGKVETLYRECVFDGAKLHKLNSLQGRFDRCSFRNCNIRELFSHGHFTDCIFSGSSIRDSVFDGNPWSGGTSERSSNDFRGNDFRGNDFRDTSMVWTEFRNGVDLTQQLLPTGPDYLTILDFEAAIPALQAMFDNIEPIDQRKVMARVLERLEDHAARNNDQIFTRYDNLCGNDPAMISKLRKALP